MARRKRMVEMRKSIGLLFFLAFIGGCGQSHSKEAGGLAIAFSTEPSRVRVGETALIAKLAGEDGNRVSVKSVRFHYYPFVFRVKDSLASPDEIVRVIDASVEQDRYSAKAKFDRPGPWKIVVRVIRAGKPDTDAIFTLDVRS